MGETKIEWATYTFNPWIGCTKVSPGCAICYAERDNKRRGWVGGWGPGFDRKRTSQANWKLPEKWDRLAAVDGVMRSVFCASLADVFEDHPSLPGIQKDLFSLIERCKGLRWLLLTKRPENIMDVILAATGYQADTWMHNNPNVWFGASAENQRRYNQRVYHLLNLPTDNLFLSVEPMLEGVRLDGAANGGRIAWVICGGESGHGARSMTPLWASNLLEDCQLAGVKFFMKQMGTAWAEWVEVAREDFKGGVLENIPEQLRVREFPW